MKYLILTIFIALTSSCRSGSEKDTENHEMKTNKVSLTKKIDLSLYKKAYFAGGCFWCVESDFEKNVKGVVEVVSGYSGGDQPHPSYRDVAGGKTNHREAIEVYYDPQVVSFEKLVDEFWKMVDPTDEGGQFVDRGHHYSPAVYFQNENEKVAINRSIERLLASKKISGKLATDVERFKNFYPAEEYHQDYYKKSPVRYKFYRSRSGRDQYLRKTWGF